jgi:hypothetical protein
MTGFTLVIALIIVVGGLFPGQLYDLAIDAAKALIRSIR